MDATSQPPTEIFKALSDPVRWSIVMQMAAVDELACVTLEDTLTVAKPTISYHTKILYHAGLISVRKSGRNYYYSLRRDVLHKLLDDLWELAPAPEPVAREEDGHALPDPARQRRGAQEAAATQNPDEAVVLTW
jgi:DNA-binding transcriptional ArsR family regulator